MNFKQICKAIKEVKIQGAENIAQAAAKALLLRHNKAAVKKLLSLRPTEPCLRNTIRFVLSFSDIKEGVETALDHFKDSDKKIQEYGSKKIESGMTIFTHCHSSAVISVLRKAKAQGKRFQVYATETRPLFQGRKTAIELAKAGIPVTLFVDSAARVALKKADLFLFGADAITAESKVINKIGTELFAEVAKRYDISAYSCTDSWKFDPRSVFGFKEPIEMREAAEIWPNHPKKVKIANPAFERVSPEVITGIISELGVFPPALFVDEVRNRYSWLK